MNYYFKEPSSSSDDYYNKSSLKKFLLGVVYIFFLSFIVTLIEYFIIVHGKVLPHISESTKSYCWLTALGVIPLTLFSFFHIDEFWEKRHIEYGHFINATGYGIFIGISCIYDCNNLGLPISFGLISLISLLILIVVYYAEYLLILISYIVLIIGIGISIGYYVICVKVIQVNDTNRIGFLISMIVNIVIFCAIGVAVIYWANNDSNSHNCLLRIGWCL